MKVGNVTDDMSDLLGRLCKLPQDEEIKPITLYFWCYSTPEFVAATRWLSPKGTQSFPKEGDGPLTITYQATDIQLEEQLPGGTRIVISCPYTVLGDKVPPPPPAVPMPPPMVTKVEVSTALGRLGVKLINAVEALQPEFGQPSEDNRTMGEVVAKRLDMDR